MTSHDSGGWEEGIEDGRGALASGSIKLSETGLSWATWAHWASTFSGTPVFPKSDTKSYWFSDAITWRTKKLSSLDLKSIFSIRRSAMLSRRLMWEPLFLQCELQIPSPWGFAVAIRCNNTQKPRPHTLSTVP